MRRYLVPLIFGLGGVAILLSLGVWQVKRLAWKQDVLSKIEQQIASPPVPIFSKPFAEFMPVSATGTILAQEAHVLTSRKLEGAGFRIVAVFETQGRRILLDRGFVPEEMKDEVRPVTTATIVGNFRTVDEADGFTPEPDIANNYWFARDVAKLAKALNTEHVLVILRETSEATPPVTPWPVDTLGIPNDHLQYAITWFLLAGVWSGMTAFLLWRIRQRNA